MPRAPRQAPPAAGRPRASGPPSLTDCPRCGSPFVQPTAWEALPSGEVVLDLRCPECLALRSGTFAEEAVRALDRRLVRDRAGLRALYTRTVRDNMLREVEALREAFARDLIGPDDFTPPRRRQSPRCRAYQS